MLAVQEQVGIRDAVRIRHVVVDTGTGKAWCLRDEQPMHAPLPRVPVALQRRYGHAVPRYTSYPTAVDWVEGQILQLRADGYLSQGRSCELRMEAGHTFFPIDVGERQCHADPGGVG